MPVDYLSKEYRHLTKREIAEKAISSIEEIKKKLIAYDKKNETIKILEATQYHLERVGSMDDKDDKLSELTTKQLIEVIREQDKLIELYKNNSKKE